jgi:hypothetical protein
VAEVVVTPVTGVPVVGWGVTSPSALPAGQAIIQEYILRDINGNRLLCNSDGSITVQVEALPSIGSAFQSLPAPTTNGAVLTNGPTGVEITLVPGTSVTYTIAAAQPTSAPTLVRTIQNPAGATSYVVDQINCAAGVGVYLTAVTGVPFYRSI